MMKRTFFVVAVVALVSSTAMAATLIRVNPLGTYVTTQINAITNDGAYATGYDGGGTSDRAFLWRASDNSIINQSILGGSYMSEGHGIGYKTQGGVKQIVVGGKMSSAQMGMMTSSDGGTTFTRNYATGGSAPGTAFANAVGGDGSNDTAWMVWAEGTSSYSVSRIYGTPTVNGTATKSSPTAVYVQGMSNTGRAACARKDSGGTKQNVYLDFTSDGGTAAQNYFAGLDGTLHGQATAMSWNGATVYGQSPKTGGFAANVNYPYAYTVGGSITPLPLLPGTTGSVSLGYPYGGANGAAVGMDYTGMERAALWFQTQDGTWRVIDLTTWANDHGVLGSFTGNLRRAYTIGLMNDGHGDKYVVAGMGVAYDEGSTVALTRGFVLTMDFPEPATMAFLALGGLFMLRRRR